LNIGFRVDIREETFMGGMRGGVDVGDQGRGSSVRSAYSVWIVTKLIDRGRIKRKVKTIYKATQ
jgi:hypothetical protein